MMSNLKFVWIIVLGCLIFFIISAVWNLSPVSVPSTSAKIVMINSGMGVNEIAAVLQEDGLIRSPLLFKAIALASGKANRLRPGRYTFQGQLSYLDVLNALVKGGDEEVTVQISEGSTIFDIDALLADQGIIKPGELISYNQKQQKSYEGYLFPDTYRFLRNSGPETVIKKMTDVFKEKTDNLFTGSDDERYPALILASLLEKEVPSYGDQQLVAGILKKRLRNNWPLQVDSALCYAKVPSTCYPLSELDFKISSPYNTYMYKGLPPTPIGNPGLQAIRAALAPESSHYWYYLSEPNTRKTIFASTLEEQALNKARYLR